MAGPLQGIADVARSSHISGVLTRPAIIINITIGTIDI